MPEITTLDEMVAAMEKFETELRSHAKDPRYRGFDAQMILVAVANDIREMIAKARGE